MFGLTQVNSAVLGFVLPLSASWFQQPEEKPLARVRRSSSFVTSRRGLGLLTVSCLARGAGAGGGALFRDGLAADTLTRPPRGDLGVATPLPSRLSPVVWESAPTDN